MLKKISIVTEQEKMEILKLHERLLGLKEMIAHIRPSNEPLEDDTSELLEKLICDSGRTKRLYDEWWSKMSTLYSWEREENSSWEINFETNEIYLSTNNNSYIHN